MIQSPTHLRFHRSGATSCAPGHFRHVAGLSLGGLLLAIAILGCSRGTSAASPTAGATPTLSLSPSATPTPTRNSPLTPPPVDSAGSIATARPSESSPEAIVEDALRSSAQALIAPPEYRSGLLSHSLGDAWVARVESDYRQWYASPKLDDMITGIHNIVGASEAGAYPIATSVDGMSIRVPTASVHGDEATVEQATISYVIHRAPGPWTQPDVPYSAMCYDTLHRTPAGWRVTDASCTYSGG